MVNEETLTELVAAKSGMDRKEVEAQLNNLINHVQAGAKEGEPVEIEGFGIFKQKKKATLFEPDDVLQTEVNQKYAGMKPIELVSSFKDPVAAAPDESAAKKPVQPLTGKKEKTGAPPPSGETISAGKEKSTKKVKTEAKVNKEKKTGKKVRAAVKNKKKQPEVDREAGPMGIVLIIVAVTVAVLLAGWLLYSSGVFSNATGRASAPPTVYHSNGNGNSDNKQQAAVNKFAGDTKLRTVSSTTTVDDKNTVSSGENASAYGLKGIVQPEAKDGYTIIVHSLSRKKNAFETAESLNKKGFRTLVMTTKINGIKFWRIGIGQFKTIADAQQTAKTLPAPFKNNHFIKHQ